jgi:glucokinase
MGAPVAVGVDVGGTKMLAVTVDEGGVVLRRERLTSPRGDADGLVETIVATARTLGEGLPVGIGVAGIVGLDGTLRYGPNIDVRDLPLQTRVADELSVPVAVCNDATAALAGEMQAGAARGAQQVVMLTLGTGVGGAVAVDGQLVYGATGLAGELGHIPVLDGGRPCPCGNNGCLEAYASGKAIGDRARETIAGDDTPTRLRDVGEIDGKAVTLAALDGDELARGIVEEAGYWLGVGLTGLVNVLDPELVVVGGGAATLSSPLVIPVASRVVAERVIGAAHRDVPEIVPAELADDAGVIGAGLTAHEQASRG